VVTTDLKTIRILDLKALRAEAERATPGPWEVSSDSHAPGSGKIPIWIDVDDDSYEVNRVCVAETQGAWETMKFIASARTNVPLLLDLAEAQAAELAELRTERGLLLNASRLSARILTEQIDTQAKEIAELRSELTTDLQEHSPVTCPVCGADLTREPHRPPCQNVKVASPAGGGSDEPALSSEALAIDRYRCLYMRGELRDGVLMPSGRCHLQHGHEGPHVALDLDAPGGIRAESVESTPVAVESPSALSVLCELVDTLPKCSECSSASTRAFVAGNDKYCDVHRGLYYGNPKDLPYAAAVRKAVALIGKEGR
jgi:hypothetical protein